MVPCNLGDYEPNYYGQWDEDNENDVEYEVKDNAGDNYEIDYTEPDDTKFENPDTEFENDVEIDDEEEVELVDVATPSSTHLTEMHTVSTNACCATIPASCSRDITRTSDKLGLSSDDIAVGSTFRSKVKLQFKSSVFAID